MKNRLTGKKDNLFEGFVQLSKTIGLIPVFVDPHCHAPLVSRRRAVLPLALPRVQLR